MEYTIKKYDHLIGTAGFSDDLLTDHFSLYEGYVKNTNTVIEKMGSLEAGSSELSEVKRRFEWEFNGMRLHELYFGNMTKEDTKLSEDSSLMKKLVESFESGQACHDSFVATGLMRGIGWVITAYDTEGDRLFNTWINEHDVGLLAGSIPIIVMDVFEHAYIRDYGIKRADYINAFVSAIDWDVAQKRFEDAQK